MCTRQVSRKLSENFSGSLSVTSIARTISADPRIRPTQSVVQRRVVTSPFSAGVSGSSAVRIVNADPLIYPTQSAFYLRSHYSSASKPVNFCTLSCYLCRGLWVHASIAPHGLNAASDVKHGNCTYTTHGSKRFLISACISCCIRSQNGIRGRGRDASTQATGDYEKQPHDPASIVHMPNSRVYSHESQAFTDTKDVAESDLMLREDICLLEAEDVASMSEDELTEDDNSGEGLDAEEEFYNFIEAEDNVDELLSMLMKLEEVFPSSDPRVCHTCLQLASLCNDTNEKPEKILDYARQAFRNFEASRFPLESARALFFIGVGQHKMGDFNEALASLERCAFQMDRLDLPSSARKQELAVLRFSVQTSLGQSKISLGLNHEGLLEFGKALNAVEKALPPESPRLAFCYQELAAVYHQSKEPKEALSLGKKALSVFVKCFGPNSLEVAELRSSMLEIYYELNDHESVLCQSQAAVQILEKLGETDQAISLDLESMQAYFVLGKFDEAVTKLNKIVKRTQEGHPLHVEALILLVRAFNGLKDNTSAVEYSQKALSALEKKELNFESAKTLIKLSAVFHQLQNYDQALAISQRALHFFEKCVQEEAATYAADAQGYRGSLFLSIGKANEAIPHLQKALTIKKSIYGPESGELLDVCNNLGVAYAHAERLDEAFSVFQEAKTILNINDNCPDPMSIYIYNNLSVTCSISGRINEAIESKNHAVWLIGKASKEIILPLDEAKKELESLVQGREHGEAASSSDKKKLKQMLTSYTISSMPFNGIS